MGIERDNREHQPTENITASTHILGIFGYPVSHAMSPLMHNTAIRDLKLDYVYVRFTVTPANLSQAIQGIKALNIDGVSITIPHKVSILPYLDEVDPIAQQIGAVNTVKNIGGKLYGRNTDGEGCLKGITDAGVTLKGKQVVLFGAGGAARAVAMHLTHEVESLTIVNRTSSRLQELTTRLLSLHDIPISGILMENRDEIRQAIEHADILINTTSVGMHPDIHISPVKASWLHEDLFVHDIIYTPLQTQLLQDATKVGCRTLSGVDMLVNQGVIAFEWWTGESPNQNLMKDVVIQHLANTIRKNPEEK